MEMSSHWVSEDFFLLSPLTVLKLSEQPRPFRAALFVFKGKPHN